MVTVSNKMTRTPNEHSEYPKTKGGQTPLILGVDLDGVVGDYEGFLRNVAAEDFGVAPESIPPQTNWSLVESGWAFRDEDHFWKVHTRAVVEKHLFRDMDVIAGASEALWRISDANIWIRIITHRLMINGSHAIAGSDTLEWLETNSIPYRDICFTGRKVEVGANVYIDDAPHNLDAIQAGHPNSYVVCYDQIYNRDQQGLRARNWTELADWIIANQTELQAGTYKGPGPDGLT